MRSSNHIAGAHKSDKRTPIKQAPEKAQSCHSVRTPCVFQETIRFIHGLKHFQLSRVSVNDYDDDDGFEDDDDKDNDDENESDEDEDEADEDGGDNTALTITTRTTTQTSPAKTTTTAPTTTMSTTTSRAPSNGPRYWETAVPRRNASAIMFCRVGLFTTTSQRPPHKVPKTRWL